MNEFNAQEVDPVTGNEIKMTAYEWETGMVPGSENMDAVFDFSKERDYEEGLSTQELAELIKEDMKKTDVLIESPSILSNCQASSYHDVIIVYYVDVGQLSPVDAKAFVAQVKKAIMNQIKLRPNCCLVTIPVRNTASRFEILNLSFNKG